MNVFSRDRFTDESGGLRDRFSSLPPWVRWGAPVIAIVALAFLGWLGFEAVGAKSNLEQARNNAQQAKDALLSGKSEDAIRFAQSTQIYARKAQAATHSTPWNIAAAVPLLGSPLKATQQMSDVVVGLADTVLLPGAQMGAGISPDNLVSGMRIDLNLLRSEEPRLSELSAAAAKLDAQSQAIAEPAYLSLIGDARSELQEQTSRLSKLLQDASIAAQLAPSMLGGDGPRTYLMGFQTPAEARGTGGLLGGVGILRFDNGIPSVNTLASNLGLRDATADVDLGPEFNKVYGWTNPLTDFRNSNLSPHFPFAAQIWKSMWERQSKSGETLDGVFAIDPVALSYVLGAIGPVTLADGEVISADNVVELTMSTAYLRFPQDPVYKDTNARKQYLQDIAGAVVKKLTGPLPSPRKLLDALGRATAEGRISVWSANPNDEKLLLQTSLAHAVPDDAAPYAQVVINNLAGGKMDYYLRREIEYAADSCSGDFRNSTVTLKLTNTANPDQPLPNYVGGSAGLPAQLNIKVPNGTMVSSVRVIATKGSRLLSVTSNGDLTQSITHMENGHPSFEVQMAISPGKTVELAFRLSEPTSPGAPQVPVQPLIDNPRVKISVPEC